MGLGFDPSDSSHLSSEVPALRSFLFFQAGSLERPGDAKGALAETRAPLDFVKRRYTPRSRLPAASTR
jgi:hypothetical protein